MSPTLQKRVGLLFVALLAAMGTWFLLSTTSEVSDSPETSRPTSLKVGREPSPEVGEADDDDNLAASVRTPTGRAEPILDAEADDARSAMAYRQRIDDNIAHLTYQAEVARLDGRPQRAEIMEKRIRGLKRRLAEFEDEQGQLAAPG